MMKEIYHFLQRVGLNILHNKIDYLAEAIRQTNANLSIIDSNLRDQRLSSITFMERFLQYDMRNRNNNINSNNNSNRNSIVVIIVIL